MCRLLLEDILYGLLFIGLPLIDIAAVIALQHYECPWRLPIYGLWFCGSVCVLSMYGHAVLSDLGFCDGRMREYWYVLLLTAVLMVFVMPFSLVFALLGKRQFLVRAPKYKFALQGSMDNANQYINTYYSGFAPLRPIIGEYYVLIFRDADMVSLKLRGILGDRL